MKKLISLAILAGFLAMAVGCGGDNTGPTGTKGSTEVKSGPGGSTVKASGTTTAPKP